MVVEAVSGLADRHGSSIVAIRKYIQSNFQLQRQQTASFNSLTLKALQKCVALEILEFDRRLYRLSDKEKSARKERERMLRAAQLSASHDDNGVRALYQPRERTTCSTVPLDKRVFHYRYYGTRIDSCPYCSARYFLLPYDMICIFHITQLCAVME